MKVLAYLHTYNAAEVIDGTIHALCEQTYPIPEILLVDNASTDGTLDLIKSYPHLKWVSEKDEGHYHAMNKGIARATGEVLVILNADDWLRPEALRKVAEAFQQHPDWEALFARYKAEHPRLAEQCQQIQKRELPAGWDKDIPVFPTDPPVRATLGVGRLAGATALAEIMITAVK